MDDSKREEVTTTLNNNHYHKTDAVNENGAAELALLEKNDHNQSIEASCKNDKISFRLVRSGRTHRFMALSLGVFAIVGVLLLTFFLGRLSANTSPQSGKISTEYYSPSNITPANAAVSMNNELLKGQVKPRKNFSSIEPLGTPIVRLSNIVSPYHYDIFTDLRYLQEKRYSGTVTVRLQCSNGTDKFSLHVGKEITLSVMEMHKMDDRGRKLESVNIEWSRQNKLPLLTVHLKDGKLNENSLYSLKIDFVTVICGQRSGFVCAHNNNGNELIQNAEKIFLATKFEPNFARTAFPCFDEPQFKATFNYTVLRTREMTVLTNTPTLKKTRQTKGDIVEQFKQTPPMSVYLFAIVVGPLVSQEARTNRGVKVAIWTKAEDKKRAKFALNYAVHAFNSIEDYFMVNYPMSKLDLVALDHYPVGGMENWGLIMFHNQMLLYSEDEPLTLTETSGKRLASKFKVAHVIAHELLHQWFGNLVTMSWWSELWLNEGFAMFYLNYFVKNDFEQMIDFHAFWKLSQTWTRQTQLPDSDQKPPLVRNFSNEETVSDAFDEWNLYSKGSSMVKMLWDLLGESALRGGLINYLTANAYKSVTLENLWENLGQKYLSENDTSLGKIMKKWLTNPGFPELHVTREYSNGDIHVEQRLADFENNLAYWNSSKLLNYNYTWSIPVAYIVQENLISNQPTGIPFWLHNKNGVFNDHTLTANQWLLINPNFQFPYRINYDAENWQLLIKQLIKDHHQISSKSRAQLILDASYFLRETENVQLFIELLSYLKKETEILPLIMGLQEMFALFDQYKATSLYPYLTVYFRPAIAQITILREDAKRDAELDAIWNMDQSFDLTLRLFQCITNHRNCHIEKEEVQGFLTIPLSTNSDKLAMVCQYLYRKAESSDKVELLRWLEQTASRRGDIVLLSGCVRDRKLNSRMVSIVIENRNIKLLGSTIAGAYSLSYNAIVHQEIWTQLASLDNNRLMDLFKDDPILQRMMLTHVGSLSEFSLAKKAFGIFAADLNYLEAALEWRQQIVPKLEQWLMEEMNIL